MAHTAPTEAERFVEAVLRPRFPELETKLIRSGDEWLIRYADPSTRVKGKRFSLLCRFMQRGEGWEMAPEGIGGAAGGYLGKLAMIFAVRGRVV